MANVHEVYMIALETIDYLNMVYSLFRSSTLIFVGKVSIPAGLKSYNVGFGEKAGGYGLYRSLVWL